MTVRIDLGALWGSDDRRSTSRPARRPDLLRTSAFVRAFYRCFNIDNRETWMLRTTSQTKSVNLLKNSSSRPRRTIPPRHRSSRYSWDTQICYSCHSRLRSHSTALMALHTPKSPKLKMDPVSLGEPRATHISAMSTMHIDPCLESRLMCLTRRSWYATPK